MADVLTDRGRAIIVGRIIGGRTGTQPGANVPLHVAWGIGTATALRVNTTLASETAEARAAGSTSGQVSATAGAEEDIYRVEATMTNNSGGSRAITEAGVFDATKAQGGATPVGNMFIRSDFAVNNIPNGDSMIFRYDLKFT